MHPDPNRTESQIGRLTLTVEEVAQVLGLSRSATYEAIARGEIPSLRFGRRIVVTRRALHRILGILGDGDLPIEHPSTSQT